MIELVTGGARSGKSRYAEECLAGRDDVLYIATAKVLDEEMAQRVRLHRAQRPAIWRTHEGYRDLDGQIGREGAVLLDCMTNMATNILFDHPADWDAPRPEEIAAAERDIEAELDALLSAMEAHPQGRYLLVTNELGMGIVPPTPLGRAFRDIAGRANQRVAARADRVTLLISGIPVRIKG